MMTLYRALIRLATPWGRRRLHRHEHALPAQAGRYPERLGQIEPLDSSPIWLHCASVGEVNAAAPLIEALLAEQPRYSSLLLSTLTLTGAERARALFGQRLEHRLPPLDRPDAIKHWLDRAKPSLALFMETELWPETFLALKTRGIPLALINARLSDRGFQRSRWARPLFRKALAAVDLALTQSARDAERFQALGLPPERQIITGNMKFDLNLPDTLAADGQALAERIGQRPCWVAGSTRPGEESIVIEAHRQLLARRPDAALILAPRHPERTDEIIDQLERSGLEWAQVDQQSLAQTQVVVVDRLGQLLSCYASAPVAFVGGSLVPVGGHNLLEPAALGKCVLAGPYLEQQSESAEALLTKQALVITQGAEELAQAVAACWADPKAAEERGARARSVVASGRGSVARTLTALNTRGWLSATDR